MFIISLAYKVPLELIENHLSDHIQFLEKQYSLGNFILSGRKNPRTGGLIISPLKDKEKLLIILKEDPFKKHNLAEYEITEVVPSMASKELKYLIE
ncbi:MAG: GTP cyclohydrolase [Apibacter sp.]|nr:GTP cyclohydrolase [Apibacter sp.]